LSEVEKSIGTAPLPAENVKVCKPHHNCLKTTCNEAEKAPGIAEQDLKGTVVLLNLNRKGWELLGKVNTV
jgi:hypothetical protein